MHCEGLLLTVHALQHDAQMDYYGKRLATCSSDRSVRVFEVIDGSNHKLLQKLDG
jgi:protein transport protein SEC13